MSRTATARRRIVTSLMNDRHPVAAVASSASRTDRRITVAALITLLLAAVAAAQPDYSFTSGNPFGDGFQWPASPTGLLDQDGFFTPDGIWFYNYIGNNLLFDSQYQVIGNAPGFFDDAMWGNPLDDGYGTVDIDLYGYGPPQIVAFDFAWSVAGSPFATPDSVDVYLEDSEGRYTIESRYLNETFTGLDGFDGYADRLTFDASSLIDNYEGVDGGPFVDIAFMYVYVDAIATGDSSSEFGIDNFAIDGSTMGGELFPSVNGGTIDVTGSTISRSILRGTGIETIGLEVTNGTASDTTYSTQILPGAQLTDAGQANNEPILAGETIYKSPLASVDQSLPSGEYDATIRLINDGDPFDPDNDVTLRLRLFDPPSLTAPSPVDVTADENAQLGNAAPAVDGWRASVKLTGTTVTGPFTFTGFDDDTPVKPNRTIEADVAFDRYGLLSGGHTGMLTTSLTMTAYIGFDESFETFLFDAEPVPDAEWTLNATLPDMLTDSKAYAASDLLGPSVIGVNNHTTAATLPGGTATGNGNLNMNLIDPPSGTTTDVIRKGAATDFSGAVPVHVVQMTYRDLDLCPDVTEANLRLLSYSGGDWQLAVNGNTGGSPAFYSGSFADFAATLGGSPLSSALGTHGLDTAGNHAWAIVNHEGTFGVGQLGQSCDIPIPGDLDNDGDVDGHDAALLSACASGAAVPVSPACAAYDYDGDNDLDQSDFGLWQLCFSGENIPGDPDCMD